MKRDWGAPADTAMMTIVHDALRRDLRQLQVHLAAEPPADRRPALAEHITWLMRFLRAHHSGEDSGLYPALRAANPAAGPLVDAMDVEHQAIHPPMEALEALAPQWRRSGSSQDRRALLASLDELAETLLPHLAREEAEAMPLVSASLTQRQWHDWDQRYNIAPKSLSVLAEEGNWLLDGLEGQRRRTVLDQVPLLPRLVVLYVFGPRYRRHAAARWGGRASTPASRAGGNRTSR